MIVMVKLIIFAGLEPHKQGMREQAVKPGGVQKRRPCNDLSQYYFHLYFAQTKGKYQMPFVFCLLFVLK